MEPLTLLGIFVISYGLNYQNTLSLSNFSVENNSNLDGGGTRMQFCQIKGVNCSNQKFREDIEKGIKVQGSKV